MDAQKKVDPQLLSFIQEETNRQKFAGMVHVLTDQCWDVCLGNDRPAAKMDSRQQTCLNNCVNRFVDASTFLMQRLGQMGNQMG